MKVGSTVSPRDAYTPLNVRLESFLMEQVLKARRAGSSEIEVVLKDVPATHEALKSLNSKYNIDYNLERSDSLKATLRF